MTHATEAQLRPTSIAGVLMLVGAALVLITIGFEYRIGWIGVPRDTAGVTDFVAANWVDLKRIWTWQALGHTCFTVAYLLRVMDSEGTEAALWALLMICGLVVIIAFGLTLGGTGPALRVVTTEPWVYETLRGLIRGLYSPGGFVGMAAFTVMFTYHTVAKLGIVGRRRGGITLGIVVAAILLGATTSLDIKVTGALWFLLPAVMGISLIDEGRNRRQ
ncbi:MAG: hypothetical protein AAGF72_13190 [Pseudomonadota bacterium]